MRVRASILERSSPSPQMLVVTAYPPQKRLAISTDQCNGVIGRYLEAQIARFEPNNYGFRPGRSCHDAIEAIFTVTAQKAKYVLDADIAKCFDRINHKALLEKLNTFPTIRRQIRAWLQAGVMDGKELFPTTEGTPQGGVISPLLSNIALHGMENRIRQVNKTANLVRYADDFVILHPDITVIHKCQQVVAEWLSGMGLELKSSKTRVTHTLNPCGEEKPGFDFLGFTVRQFPVGIRKRLMTP